MSERIKEQLSALLDDELSASEAETLTRHLAEDEQAREKAARYQLISAGFRGEWADPEVLKVAAAVRERLDDEPTVLAPKPSTVRSRWKGAAVGAAIAASAAVVAISLNLGQGPDLSGDSATIAAQTPEFVPSEQLSVLTQAPERFESKVEIRPFTLVSNEPLQLENAAGDRTRRDRLGRYLMEHNEFATQGGASGFMPYTSVVSYDNR